ERPRAVHFCAAAPGAAELPVDEHRDATVAACGRELVGGNNGIDGGHDERRFRRGERDERLQLGGGRRGRGRRRRVCLLRPGRLGLRQPGGDRRAGKSGAEQEFATRFIRHRGLPLFVLWNETKPISATTGGGSSATAMRGFSISGGRANSRSLGDAAA